MDRQERFKKLEETRATLKQEFVGIDNIIDDIIKSIEPWYITPEVIKRPVIVSLWGMTGTGKSSIAKRITEILGINKSTMYFDCGREADDNCRNEDIVNSTCELLGIEVDEIKSSESLGNDSVFIFDEFQYARTITEDGLERPKSNLRSIWKIIDDGILDITNNFNYELYNLSNFIDDLNGFAKLYPNIKVKNNIIEDPNDVKIVLDNVGCYLYSDREIPSLNKYSSGRSDDVYPTAKMLKSIMDKEDEGEKEDPYRPLKVISSNDLRTIAKRLNRVDINTGNNTLQDIFGSETLGEICCKLKNAMILDKTHKYLDCTKSLIFIIGNLDEAFKVEKETNPDIDADTYNSITSKVTVSDIKDALKSRFRAEQIARIGNNLIKYPTLKKIHFEQIIKKEVSRIISDFKNIEPKLNIIINPEIYKLIYLEGVYPTQGVRPIFTTIGTIFTPYFSKIIIEKSDKDTSVTMGIKDKHDSDVDFKIPSTIITLTFSSGKVVEYPYNLQLGSIRDPKLRSTRYISAVHESGHAIIMAITTGKAPNNIVAVSTDKGGFCDTYDNEKEGKIYCKKEIDDDIMISFGGYEAEKLIYGNDRPELCLMGSSSDIETAWNTFSNSVYRDGYFEPVSFTSCETEVSNDGLCSGFDFRSSKVIYDGSELLLNDAMKQRWEELKKETYKLLLVEKTLIKKLAIYLGEHGAMNKETFIDFIKNYGNNLTLEQMENTRKNNSSDYYLSILEK